MKTVSMKTKAWLTQHSLASPKDLIEGRLNNLTFHTDASMKDYGWTFVGAAEVIVQVPDEKTLIDNKVAALREEVKAIRAEATANVTQIEGRIKSLLAITCDSSLVTEPQ